MFPRSCDLLKILFKMDRLVSASNWNTLKSGTSPEPLSTNSDRGKGNDPPVEEREAVGSS